ncbi:hypothetical protein [Paracoccus denitrificans]|jgi:hypothetical protein|uniref:Uncharacterized protein n=1 Tax=Paracoccus denitrificans (strain Pd 1222) TaxID=318586 RepID=A1B8F6_PARDP|nr:hypothetical protein [Paracoccus denitrificans]ABL71800.1 hypothetical protein Pden_3733 [Paracoccus denitrificans PD1222]MBB4628103.1 hypothetical protein [Paracoccus denitrificans]MCU7429168.1 hypothetical protein [Paracoccus denitrificans]QAR28384.1 hypothetical protein EO213_18955 [Paracoccus denitrificans]UPV96520.1 hypothetical protein M0K93_19045 [Paracoccus denitrificans]
MQITHDNDCEHRLGHDCTCGASSYQFDLAAARAEIERLTKERDEARAQVAAAYVAASRAQPTYTLRDPDDAYGVNDVVYASQLAIRALTPADAKAALEARDREKVREGMKRAVDLYPQGIAAILAEMEKEGGE